MIILSIITVKDKTVETTDVVNIANGADLHNPEVVKEILANRFGIKRGSLTLTEYSPFNNTYFFEWEGIVENECYCFLECIEITIQGFDIQN